ncbi:hypothetical protein ACFSLT_30925 [Novosphingobium resinovorum]
MLHAARDDMVSVEADAEVLLRELDEGHAYLNCTLLAQLMSARRELYHFSDMLKLEAETRVALARPGSGFASIALKASVAPTLMAQGKTQFARRFLEEALNLAHQIHGEGSGLAALALPLAELLYDANDVDGAAALVDTYLPVVREWAFADQMASGYLVNARLRAARGDLPGALSTLNDAHLVAIECGLERLRAIVVAEEVRLLVKAGQVEEAERHFLAATPRSMASRSRHCAPPAATRASPSPGCASKCSATGWDARARSPIAGSNSSSAAARRGRPSPSNSCLPRSRCCRATVRKRAGRSALPWKWRSKRDGYACSSMKAK